MTDKHTPAPWKLCDRGYYSDFAGDSRVILADDHRIAVVQVGRLDEEGDANAHLIAAAPKLLKECERAQDELASTLKDGIKEHFTPEMLQRWFKGVTWAIAKAKGEI